MTARSFVVFALLLGASLPAAAQQWTEVRSADRPITVSASGTVTSREAIRFGPPPNRSWRITIMEIAREGSLVAEGDVLAKFDGSATASPFGFLRRHPTRCP